MTRLRAFSVICSALILNGCSLTEIKKQDSFEVQASLLAADAALENLASSHSMRVNRDEKPGARAIPRDYLATVIRGHCMLIVEGVGSPQSATVTVTLEAKRGTTCDDRMTGLFTELRTRLLAPHS